MVELQLLYSCRGARHSHVSLSFSRALTFVSMHGCESECLYSSILCIHAGVHNAHVSASSSRASTFVSMKEVNNESSEVFDIFKPGRRVKIKGYRQYNVNNL